jgi:hypothetical protein
MDISELGAGALVGLTLAVLVFLHLRGQRASNRRHREALSLMSKGQTAAQAAKAVKMPWGQRAAFILSSQWFGANAMGTDQSNDCQPAIDPARMRTRRFVLHLGNGDKVYVDGAVTIDEALQRGGVHPANLSTYRCVDVPAEVRKRDL